MWTLADPCLHEGSHLIIFKVICFTIVEWIVILQCNTQCYKIDVNWFNRLSLFYLDIGKMI